MTKEKNISSENINISKKIFDKMKNIKSAKAFIFLHQVFEYYQNEKLDYYDYGYKFSYKKSNISRKAVKELVSLEIGLDFNLYNEGMLFILTPDGHKVRLDDIDLNHLNHESPYIPPKNFMELNKLCVNE